MRRIAAIACAALAAALAAGCGGGADLEAPGAGTTAGPDRETAWLATLARLALVPGGRAVAVEARGAAPELSVTIAVAKDADSTYTFGDGLFGAEAYTFAGTRWVRVDAAEIRTMVAPMLRPGERASVRLPVRAAPSYRVLVKAEGRAFWDEAR